MSFLVIKMQKLDVSYYPKIIVVIINVCDEEEERFTREKKISYKCIY